MRRSWLKGLLVCCFLLSAIGAAKAEPQLVDRIVAVVDEEIVLHSDVMQRVTLSAMQRGVDPGEMPTEQITQLYTAVLENLVQEKLLLAKAKEDSIEVDEEQIDEAVYQQMSQVQGQLGEETLEAQLRAEGMTARDLRDQFRKNFERDFLRQQVMARLGGEVEISYKDVEDFRTRFQDELPPLVSVSHILIEIKPSEARDSVALKKTEALIDRMENGEDFGELAKQLSDDPGTAPLGGDLGFFSRGQFLPEFEDAAFSLKPGEVSEPIKTAHGYHVIRVDAVSGREIRARHILISVRSSDADEAVAYQRALDLYSRIRDGADLAELARDHSAHEESAQLGGHLGIFPSDSLPPAFVDAIRTMKLGDVSIPVKTEFGWHLVRLDDDREKIEEVVRKLKLSERFRTVITELRNRVYVDVRSTPP
jgi:peptidyl-prolyl cis-trans isomerase SurA